MFRPFSALELSPAVLPSPSVSASLLPCLFPPSLKLCLPRKSNSFERAPQTGGDSIRWSYQKSSEFIIVVLGGKISAPGQILVRANRAEVGVACSIRNMTSTEGAARSRLSGSAHRSKAASERSRIIGELRAIALRLRPCFPGPGQAWETRA